MQYVRVEVAEGRAYTYTWDDEAEPALEPGERVMLPSSVVQDRPFEGKVLRVVPDAGDYKGPLKSVLSRVEPLDPSPEQVDQECTCVGGDVDVMCPHHGLL